MNRICVPVVVAIPEIPGIPRLNSARGSVCERDHIVAHIKCEARLAGTLRAQKLRKENSCRRQKRL